MAGNPKIQIDIVADGKDARKEVDKTGKSFEKFGKGLDKGATVAAGALGVLGGLGVLAIDAASDLERASTTVDRTFGDSAGKIKDWADEAAENVGISSTAYQEMAGSFGVALTTMGLDADTAAVKTNDLITVAGDMALALGTDVPAAASALSAGLRGEFDALGEFGVQVSGATVEAGLAAKGLDDLTGAAYDAAYQQELLDQVLAGAGAIYGGYRAETDTTAEKQQELTAKWEDAQAQLGTALLPLVSDLADALSDAADWVVENSDTITAWLPVLAAAAGAVWVLNWAMAANPIVLVTLAILALIGVFYYFRDAIGQAATKVDEFMSVLDNVIPGLGPIRWAIDLMRGDFDAVAGAIGAATSAIYGLIAAWEAFTTTKIAGTPIIAPPGGGRSAPGGSFAAPSGLTSARSLTATGPAAAAAAPVQITVTGALDPDRVARQIDRLLRERGRRTGAVITR